MKQNFFDAYLEPTLLDEEMKDYLYTDGTLVQLLREKNLVPSNFSALNDESAEKISTGAFCLLTHHASSGRAQVIDFSAKTVAFAIPGGLLLRALKTPEMAIGLVSVMKEIKNSLSLSSRVMQASMLAAAATQNVFQEIARACPISPQSKLNSMVNRDQETKIKSLDLPKELPYSPQSLAFPELPPCNSDDLKNLFLQQHSYLNCSLMAMSTLLPLKWAMSLLAVPVVISEN